MSGEIIPFVFSHDGQEDQIRLVRKNGDPWFVGADSCNALGLANHRDSLRRLKPQQKGVIRIDSLGGPQQTTIISESGLMLLAMRSDKERARVFQDWLAEEVLPTLRRTGKYEIMPAVQSEPCGPALLKAVNEGFAGVHARIDGIEGMLQDRRKNFSKATERYVCEGLVTHYACRCPYCNDKIIVSKRGELLDNAQLHHGNGNRRDNQAGNCMPACDDCHDRIHNPNHKDHMPAHKASAFAIVFHERLQQEAARVRSPQTGDLKWHFQVLTQADMGFPVALKKLPQAAE